MAHYRVTLSVAGRVAEIYECEDTARARPGQARRLAFAVASGWSRRAVKDKPGACVIARIDRDCQPIAHHVPEFGGWFRASRPLALERL